MRARVSGRAGHVADQRRPGRRPRRCPSTELAGLHGHHVVAPDPARDRAPGRRRRRRPGRRPRGVGRSFVRGRDPRPGGPGRRPRRGRGRRAGSPRSPSIPVHSSTKPGIVLAVVPTSTTSRPGTHSPSTAAMVAIRWSSYVETTPPCNGRGTMTSPSSVSRASPPSAVISVASAASRSVSWWRRCAMPRSRDGVLARAHTAASTGASSPTSPRSRSMPSHPSGAGDRQPPRCRAPRSAPNRGSRWRSASPAWVVRSGQPGTVTLPPVTTAAARKAAALDRSGSTYSRPTCEGARLDPPRAGRPRARRSRRRTAASPRSCRCAAPDGSRAAAVPYLDRVGAPGRRQQQRADELRRQAWRR